MKKKVFAIIAVFACVLLCGCVGPKTHKKELIGKWRLVTKENPGIVIFPEELEIKEENYITGRMGTICHDQQTGELKPSCEFVQENAGRDYDNIIVLFATKEPDRDEYNSRNLDIVLDEKGNTFKIEKCEDVDGDIDCNVKYEKVK